ncbi:lipocalin family protein [Asticcacaulis solisilvae]|uniref:lipocalin family protein n=1 Tax=Asticcacaulis solisilvae TaxID=1217274 RepID=UPI003FD7BF2E
MKPHHIILPLAVAGIALAACASLPVSGPVGNRSVPEPAKPVDIKAYGGLWYEMARYENGFERDCEGVTAEYGLLPDGKVSVTNACRKGALDGPARVSRGTAKVVPGSNNAKLKVSFFGPFYVGDYWVLDHADDYSWSIVGEPSGRYLWILTREAAPSPDLRQKLQERAGQLGYDVGVIRPTRH